MTSTEQAGRKPVAKEIAEEAKAIAEQANTTAQQVLAEMRDMKEVGALPSGGYVDPKLDERISALDKDVEGLLENLNELAGTIAAAQAPAMGADGKPLDLSTVVVEMQRTFKAHADKIDQNNEAVKKALADIQNGTPQGDGTTGTLVARVNELRNELDEAKGWIQTFDEAGVSPASAEDVSSLHQRLLSVEAFAQNAQLQTATGGNSQVINYQGDQVPQVHRQVWQLMNLVESLGKDSQAAQNMGGYKFRSIDAAMDAVGRALRQVGLMFVPGEILDKRIERYTTEGHEWKNGTKYAKTLNWTHVWVTQRYYFVSLIDGSRSEPFEMDSEARDNGDKSTSKADSMRMKYALLQALCIPVNGLPESDGRDGTEGATDESWENARTREEIEQDKRRQQQAAEPERGHPVEDEPQGPPPGYEQAHPSGQQQIPQEPDTRTDDEKARAVVAALRKLNDLPPDQRRDRFVKIANAVREQHLGQLMVEGITITRHLAATNGNLGGNS